MTKQNNNQWQLALLEHGKSMKKAGLEVQPFMSKPTFNRRIVGVPDPKLDENQHSIIKSFISKYGNGVDNTNNNGGKTNSWKD